MKKTYMTPSVEVDTMVLGDLMQSTSVTFLGDGDQGFATLNIEFAEGDALSRILWVDDEDQE